MNIFKRINNRCTLLNGIIPINIQSKKIFYIYNNCFRIMWFFFEWCNKLFNNYKIKQIKLNDLQQRYLFIEGEKYIFFPIIKNYIIKYNRPCFPILPKSEIHNQENPLTYNNYFIYINNTNNFNSISNFTSISEDTLFSKYKSSKKSYHKKKNGLISMGDNIF